MASESLCVLTGPGKKRTKEELGRLREGTLDSQLLGTELPAFSPHHLALYLRAGILFGGRKREIG